MKRFMLLSAVLLVIGMALVSAKNLFTLGMLLAVLLVLMFFCIRKSNRTAFILCAIVPVIGFGALSLCISHYENLSSPLYNTACEAQGRVTAFYDYGGYAYADVSVSSLTTCTGTYKENRKIRIAFYNHIPGIKYADTINFKAVLREPTKETMSGQNRKLNLFTKGIGLWADCDAENVRLTGNDFSFFRPADFAYYIKNGICSFFDKSFDGNTSGLIKGIITGDKSGLDDEVYDAFKTCGLAHTVAVSGIHINILIGAAIFVLGLFKIRKRLAAVAVYIALAWMLALVAGLSASAVRASLTVTVFYTAWILNRESDSLNSLGIAAVIMLLVNPATFYDVGFRLSVSSVAGILLFSKQVKMKIAFLPDAIADILSVSFAAQLGSLPVIMYHFGRVSVICLLANLIVCPIIPIIMALAAFSLALCKIPAVGAVLLQGLKILTDGTIYTVLILSNVPYASLVTGSIGAAGIIIYSAGLITLGLWLYGRRRKALYCLAVFLAIVACIFIVKSQSSRAQLAFLNVGNGDCAVFASKDAAIMIDAGGGRDFDIAKMAIIPYMEKAGLSRIDFAFVSHYNIEHCEGYLTLMTEGKVKTLVLPDLIYENEMKDKLERTAKLSNTSIVYVKGGEKMDCGDLRIDVFDAYMDENENSGMVYYLDWGNNRICFTGDIEASGEKKLCTRFADTRCDILKVARHGSAKSTSEAFVRATQPKYAVVSRNRSIPDKTQTTLASYGAAVLSTYNSGTIVFNIDKTKIISVHSGRGFDNEL